MRVVSRKKISFNSVSKYVSDLRLYPLVWGNKYSKLSKSITNKAIVDFEIYSLRKMDFDSFRRAHNLVFFNEWNYYILAIVSYPIRMIYNKIFK